MRLSQIGAVSFLIVAASSYGAADMTLLRDGYLVNAQIDFAAEQVPVPRDPAAPRPTPPRPRDPSVPPQPRDPQSPPVPRPPTPRPPTPRPPTPRPPTPPPPTPREPEPRLPAESVFTAKNVAKNQARMMANRVVAIYGRAEQVLYSFSMGLNQGIASYNFENGGFQQNAEFLMAVQKGQGEGQSAGYARGEQEGQFEGSVLGAATAAARFEAVVDKGTPPDLTAGSPAVPTRIFQAPIADPASLEELLNRHNAELYLILNGYDYAYEEYYARNIWGAELVTMAQLYNWRAHFGFNRFIDSYSRDEWALDAWRHYRLGGRYQNEVRYYDRVTDPSQVSNAAEIRAVFASEFKRTYRETIDDKWMQSVRRVDPLVLSRGLQLGYSVSREHATELGRVYGYRAAYGPASTQGFQSSYAPAYQNRFRSEVTQYQQNPVISDASFELEGAPFLPYSAIGLRIDRLRNAGQLGGELTIKIDGGHTKSFAKKTRAIKAASSDAVPQTIDWVGQVDYSVVPDEMNRVEVSVGNFRRVLTYKVSMYDVVKALGQSPDENARVGLQEYIRLNLANEFESGKQDALLAHLVGAYNAASFNEKMTITRSRETWKGAYGREPGLFSSKRGRWQKAQAQLNSLR